MVGHGWTCLDMAGHGWTCGALQRRDQLLVRQLGVEAQAVEREPAAAGLLEREHGAVDARDEHLQLHLHELRRARPRGGEARHRLALEQLGAVRGDAIGARPEPRPLLFLLLRGEAASVAEPGAEPTSEEALRLNGEGSSERRGVFGDDSDGAAPGEAPPSADATEDALDGCGCSGLGASTGGTAFMMRDLSMAT